MFDTCVILAGGLGSRLRPLTTKCPKPLIEVNNSPFLLYLIEYLSSYGIANFIILTGYLGEKFEMITRHYEDRKGISVRLIRTPAEYLTTQRVQESIKHIEGDVLICYGDVYAEPDITQLYSYFKNTNQQSLSISAISRHNIPDEECQYKDIGFISINIKLLHNLLIKAKPGKVENLIFSRQGHCILKDDWSYCSLTDMSSYTDFERQLKEPVTLIIDRDGVINKALPKGKYVKRMSELSIIDPTIETLRREAENIKRIIVVTNQPWIGRSQSNKQEHDMIMDKVIMLLKNIVQDVKYMYCPHTYDDRCLCRKPKNGLIKQLLISDPWLRRKTIVIGDSYADSQLAQSMGDVGFIAVDSERHGLQHASLKKAIEPRLCTDHRYYRLRGLPHGRFDSK